MNYAIARFGLIGTQRCTGYIIKYAIDREKDEGIRGMLDSRDLAYEAICHVIDWALISLLIHCTYMTENMNLALGYAEFEGISTIEERQLEWMVLFSTGVGMDISLKTSWLVQFLGPCIKEPFYTHLVVHPFILVHRPSLQLLTSVLPISLVTYLISTHKGEHAGLSSALTPNPSTPNGQPLGNICACNHRNVSPLGPHPYIVVNTTSVVLCVYNHVYREGVVTNKSASSTIN